MRKTLLTIITCILMLSTLIYDIKAIPAPPKISADGVVLMNLTTGQILYSKNMDTPYPPASTTKIMTALITLENCKLNDIVTVGKNPPFAEGSKIYLLKGEKLTVKDLLYALLLQSANDSAEALAEHISGSVEDFSKLMNKRALELGCKNTNFVNPHGLYDDKHRTSAKDLALILKELSKHPEFKTIATKSIYYIAPTNIFKEKRPIWNKNKLVQKSSKCYYEGCEGGKTGYTIQSKHSYVATASKNNQKLIAVLLHDSKHTYWEDVRGLFDYGFNNFTVKTLFSKGDSIGKYTLKDNTEVPLLAGETFYYTTSKESKTVPELKINYENFNKTSFNKGENILNANVIYNNKSIGTLNLISGINYNSNHPLKQLKSFGAKSKVIFKAICLILAFIIILSMLKVRKNRSI